jgi:hypothetical protein
MGILDVLPEEYDYVDYRPTLATSLLGAGATIGTVLAARGLMKGFGKKTGKGLSGSKSKMKGSINLNKRPGGKKGKLGKKAKKGASAAAAAGPEDLPMYVRGDVLPAYKPALPPRPNMPPRVGGPAPGALARSGGYANLGPKMKGPQPQLKRQGGIANLNTNLGTPLAKPKASLKRSGGMSDIRSTNEKRRAAKNPFSDKNAVTKRIPKIPERNPFADYNAVKPKVPAPPKNPFSDYYAVKKRKPKIPERNPFADYNAVKKTKPKVPSPPKNPFSDYYAVKRKGKKK